MVRRRNARLTGGRLDVARAQRIAELAPDARSSVLNKLFSEYGGSPGKSPTGKGVASLVSPGDDTRSVDAATATKAWNWREDASEWELKSLTSALGLPSAGTRPELVEVVQKHLTDLAEPADQLSVSLAKLARIITAHDKSPSLKLGEGDERRASSRRGARVARTREGSGGARARG